jgi:exosortase E/protease (VPEID-CTERM system)
VNPGVQAPALGARPRPLVFSTRAAAVLLAVEYLALTVAFDAAPLRLRGDGWELAGPIGWLAVPLVAAVLGTLLVLYTARPSVRVADFAREVDANVRGLLLAHVVSAALLWWLSAQIFGNDGPPAGWPQAWLSAWALAAVGSVALALVAAIPRPEGCALARRLGPALVPGAVIGVAAWIAAVGSTFLWWPLGPLTLHGVDASLRLLLPVSVFDPSRALIGSEAFQVIVAPVCSGFEGLGLTTVFLVSFLVLSRERLRFPQALLLVPIGLVAAWAANVTRLVTLVLVGTYASPEIAVGGFHARSGWLLFCGLALSSMLLVHRASYFSQVTHRDVVDDHPSAYLVPFLLLVACSMVTGLLAKEIDLLYGARIVAASLGLLAFRRFYANITWCWSWTAVGAGVLAAVAYMWLAPPPDPQASQAWQREWNGLSPWARAFWLSVRTVGSVLIVPLVKELAFRGYLLRRLISKDFERVPPGKLSARALAVSSVAFGAVHAGWLGASIAGLLYGVVQARGQSVGHAVLAHMVSNAIVAGAVLGLGQIWLWM